MFYRQMTRKTSKIKLLLASYFNILNAELAHILLLQDLQQNINFERLKKVYNILQTHVCLFASRTFYFYGKPVWNTKILMQ